MNILHLVNKAMALKWNELLPILHVLHRESGRSRLDLFKDMYHCYRDYGFNWANYAICGFHLYLDDAYRHSFLSSSEQSYAIVHRLSTAAARDIINDKVRMLNWFKPFIRRDFIDIREKDAKGFAEFLQNTKAARIFAKPLDGMGGHGIETFVCNEITDAAKLYQDLMRRGHFLVEEGIVQHPEMQKLSINAVNTLRIVTLRPKAGHARFAAAALRVCLGDAFIDNQSKNKGGMGGAVILDENGVVSGPLQTLYPTFSAYARHPKTNFYYPGFKVPFFAEAVKYCEQAADSLPDARIIGFDIAITPDGPDIVEVNDDPGPDLEQSYVSLPESYGGRGVRQRFIELLAEPDVFDVPGYIKR